MITESELITRIREQYSVFESSYENFAIEAGILDILSEEVLPKIDENKADAGEAMVYLYHSALHASSLITLCNLYLNNFNNSKNNTRNIETFMELANKGLKDANEAFEELFKHKK